MKIHRRQGIRDYAVLLLMSSLFVVLATHFSVNKNNLRLSVITYATLYLLWGIWHHRRENSLSGQVFLEYFLFSILGSVLVLGML